jgi:hypothetical protein
LRGNRHNQTETLPLPHSSFTLPLALLRLRASSRDVPMMEQGAAPAAAVRNRSTGRPGKPTGGHYDPSARCSLDWDWPNASSQEARTRGLCLWQSRRCEPPWSAERRPRSRKESAARLKDWCAAWRSTPSASRRGKKGNTAHPAPQRTRAMTHACCLTIGSGEVRANLTPPHPEERRRRVSKDVAASWFETRSASAPHHEEIGLYAFAANLSTLLAGAGLAAATFGT